MNKILVSGLINIETTLKVDSFPIEYEPVRYPFFGVNSTVSGVGYNITKALTVLGNSVNFTSVIGKDFAGKLVKDTLSSININTDYILDLMTRTPQSVIIFDKEGKRAINTDLKDIQDIIYPAESFDKALSESSIAVLCNINFSRPHLEKAKKTGKIIATDVHALTSIGDEYNQDFMKYADILFLSNVNLEETPEKFSKKVINKFGNDIIVIGLGKEGVLLCVKKDNFCERIPAVNLRKVVNTVGAGDALFSCFIHYYNKTKDPYGSIKKALVFTDYKIGTESASEGFLTETELEKII
ncbi:MAG: carbohydrate kinase family protein [Armatimonadota bacterium]